MSGLDTSLHIALSGLMAHQKRADTASANVANADTPGYTKKTLPLKSVVYGGRGQGVRTGELQRSSDAWMHADLMGKTSRKAELEAQDGLLAAVDAAHGGTDSALALPNAMSALEGAFDELAGVPESAAHQRAVVGAAEDVATSVRTMAAKIAEATVEARQQAADAAKALNGDLERLDRLNREIGGRNVPDLEDQRDQLLVSISEKAEIGISRGPGGAVSVFTRSGQQLSAPLDADAASRITGGRIGALNALAGTTLPKFAADLDRFAEAAAKRFSDQGLALFEGTGAADLRVGAAEPRLARDGTHAVPGFVPNPPGGPAGFGALLDRVNNAALAGSSGGVPHPGGSLGALARDFASSQTAVRDQMQGDLTHARDVAAAAGDALSNRTGVNVDREMIELTEAQRAYAACAKLVSVNQQMWDSVMSMVR